MCVCFFFSGRYFGVLLLKTQSMALDLTLCLLAMVMIGFATYLISEIDSAYLERIDKSAITYLSDQVCTTGTGTNVTSVPEFGYFFKFHYHTNTWTDVHVYFFLLCCHCLNFFDLKLIKVHSDVGGNPHEMAPLPSSASMQERRDGRASSPAFGSPAGKLRGLMTGKVVAHAFNTRKRVLPHHEPAHQKPSYVPRRMTFRSILARVYDKSTADFEAEGDSDENQIGNLFPENTTAKPESASPFPAVTEAADPVSIAESASPPAAVAVAAEGPAEGLGRHVRAEMAVGVEGALQGAGGGRGELPPLRGPIRQMGSQGDVEKALGFSEEKSLL